MCKMHKNDWLKKLEQLNANIINLGLERVAQIAKKLNLVNFDCPVITVGGTNGKGSCVAFLESILQAAGYSVGCYTSPHLLSFNERIKINSQFVSDQMLCEAFEIIEHEKKDLSLTYFEFTTLAALLIFKWSKVDMLVLEIGMGGRLDAVNIVDSDISIVTSIDLDHTQWLGDTREAIGHEKAGIFRKNKVAICGDPFPPESLVHYASKIGAPLYQVNKDFYYQITDSKSWLFESKDLAMKNLPLPNLPIENAATTLMAISALKKIITTSDEAISEGIKKAFLPGRFQIINEPPCILDVAHNPAAARMLAGKIGDLNSNARLLAVVGMLKDKDIKNTLAPLIPFIDAWHFGSLNIERGASSTELASQLQEFGDLNCYTYECISEAFKAASYLEPKGKIIAFGSFYTVAEILNLLQNDRLECLLPSSSNLTLLNC